MLRFFTIKHSTLRKPQNADSNPDEVLIKRFELKTFFVNKQCRLFRI